MVITTAKKSDKKVEKKFFQATVKNPKKVQLIFEVASMLVDEVVMHVSDKIIIDTIDSAHVGMLLVELTRPFFTDFINTLGEFDWGISIQDITKILKRSTSTDKIEMYKDEETGSAMQIHIISGKKKRSFKLKNKTVQVYTFEKEGMTLEMQIKQLQTAIEERVMASVVIETDFLVDIVKDAQIVSDLINVNVDFAANTMEFSASDDAGECNAMLDLKESYVKRAKINGDAKSFYSISFFDNVLKLKPVVEGFELNIGNDAPLLIKCQFLRDEEKLLSGDPGTFTYILAPRMDETEDEEETTVTQEDIKEAEEAELDPNESLEKNE